MADMNANTVTRVVDQDVLEAASISAKPVRGRTFFLAGAEKFIRLPPTDSIFWGKCSSV